MAILLVRGRFLGVIDLSPREREFYKYERFARVVIILITDLCLKL
jgi:hypothetical protein